jgi:hypothetical protein
MYECAGGNGVEGLEVHVVFPVSTVVKIEYGVCDRLTDYAHHPPGLGRSARRRDLDSRSSWRCITDSERRCMMTLTTLTTTMMMNNRIHSLAGVGIDLG